MENIQDTIIQAANVNVDFQQLKVLKNINLKIMKGEVAALVGHNGAGKSTLLKAIIGIVKYSGEIIVSDSFSYVPQGRRVFTNLTVKENIILNSKSMLIPSRITALFPVLKEKENINAGLISGGEQQMVAIARGLIQNSKILILDEPTLGLAPNLVIELFQKIKEINKQLGVTILLVEHNINSLVGIADKIYVMEKGRIKKELDSKEFQLAILKKELF